MRQDPKGKKTGGRPNPRVAGRPRKRPKTKVQANRLVAKKVSKREDAEPREPDKRLAEALQREAATDEILRVMSSSPGNVHPVLDAVAERAAGLCEAAFAQVLLVENDVLRPTAAYWADAGLDKSPGPKRTWPLTRSLAIGRAALDCKTIHHADIVPLLTTDYPTARAKQQELGFRAVLVVPLLREGGASGVIFMFRREPRPFSREQIALVETFARQAVIAIENVRLFNETKEALAQQTATSEILRAISSSPTHLQPVLEAVVSAAARSCGAPNVVIMRVEGGMLRGGTGIGQFAENIKERAGSVAALEWPITRGSISGRAVIDRCSVHVHDLAAEAEEEYPIGRELQRRFGHHTCLAMPLLSQGVPLGVITLNRFEVSPFSDKEIKLLRTFADQAVIAIENVRLYRDIEVKNRELEAASRHKSEFLANMSHELRTPLNAIIGFSEVLSERMFGEINEKQAEYIGDILQSGQHLLSLINDILDLSKIEAGRMELELSDFDLPSVIENTLTLVRERAMRRGITLARAVDEHLGMIYADERKVKQVLLNILSNALKFTPEGGKIEVRAAINDGVAEISVTDTGVGIGPEEQDAVFEEFRQVGTASKKVEGTGLGLAISRKFIELHGGKIWVRSQVGAGSTFAFTLPLQRLVA